MDNEVLNAGLIKNTVYKHGKNVIHNINYSKSITIYPTKSSFTKMDLYQVLNYSINPRIALNEHIFMPYIIYQLYII